MAAWQNRGKENGVEECSSIQIMVMSIGVVIFGAIAVWWAKDRKTAAHTSFSAPLKKIDPQMCTVQSKPLFRAPLLFANSLSAHQIEHVLPVKGDGMERKMAREQIDREEIKERFVFDHLEKEDVSLLESGWKSFDREDCSLEDDAMNTQLYDNGRSHANYSSELRQAVAQLVEDAKSEGMIIKAQVPRYRAWSDLQIEERNGRAKMKDAQEATKKMQQELIAAQKKNDECDPDFKGYWEKANPYDCQTAIELELPLFFKKQAAIVSMQGGRQTMEDAAMVMPMHLKINGKLQSCSLFVVADGHNGDECAKYIRDHLGNRLKCYLDTVENLQEDDETIPNALNQIMVNLSRDFRASKGRPLNIDRTISEQYRRLVNEKDLNSKRLAAKLKREIEEEESQIAKSVAVAVLVTDAHIWTANIGDCRAVFIPEGKSIAVTLNDESKADNKRCEKSINRRNGAVLPSTPEEVARTVGFGGYVRCAFAHALAHNEFMTGINPRANMTREKRQSGQLYIFTDGLGDVVSTNQLAQTLREECEGMTPTEKAVYLIKKGHEVRRLRGEDECAKHNGCAENFYDNITVLVADISKPMERGFMKYEKSLRTSINYTPRIMDRRHYNNKIGFH